jgi:hypothetical protein
MTDTVSGYPVRPFAPFVSLRTQDNARPGMTQRRTGPRLARPPDQAKGLYVHDDLNATFSREEGLRFRTWCVSSQRSSGAAGPTRCRCRTCS